MLRVWPTLLALFLALGLLVSTPGLALAADETGEAKPGLLTVMADLAIWTIIVFVLFQRHFVSALLQGSLKG